MNRFIDGDPYIDLANAIIILAVDDYREAYESYDLDTMLELEVFFKSDWFHALSMLDGEDIIRRLRK